MKTRTLVAIALSLLVSSAALADPWVGLFRADVNGESAELELQSLKSGGYTGTLTFMGQVAPLTAAERDEQLVGRLEAGPGEFVDLTVVADGVIRHVQFANGLRLTLVAANVAAAEGSAERMAPATQYGDEVWINGAKLSDSDRNQILQTGLRIDAGRYWYDPMCGAWGFFGGPTMGFITAGLPVAARLPSNASHGATQVFINGRNLPTQDWALLSQLAGQQIVPGRYWLDANGYAGLEGGPALINFVAAAQQSAGAGGGSGANSGGGGTWSSLLSSGGSDGQGNGFVQLPNGGFVSHGN